MACRNLTNNNITGTLPSNWGRSGAFQNLTVLDLSNNVVLAGALPPLWGDQVCCHQMGNLLPSHLDRRLCMRISPQLDQIGSRCELGERQWPCPATWAYQMAFVLTLAQSQCVPLRQGAFPRLQRLLLGNTGLSGQLPVAWGSQESFPSIVRLDLSQNILQGWQPLLPLRTTSMPISMMHALHSTWYLQSHMHRLISSLLRFLCAPPEKVTWSCRLVAHAHLCRKLAIQLGNCRRFPKAAKPQHSKQHLVWYTGDRMGQ